MEDLEETGGRTSAILRLLQCVTGPRVRRQYYLGGRSEGLPYQPNRLELYADHVILAARLVCSFAFYSTPLYLVYYLIRHGVPTVGGVLSTARSLAFIPISISLAYIVRGVGRFRNQTYTEFLKSWNMARKLKTKIGPQQARVTGIGSYDFEMLAHPVTFRHDESSVKPRRIMSTRKRGFFEWLLRLPITSLRFLAAHYVARRLIYPGSVSVYNLAVAEGLSLGRAAFKRKYDAHRARLLAVDGNSIDCMFIDRRGSPDVNARGNKLVICCEGNAAYYELGMMEAPVKLGYSAIGWNHPGFGDSSGLPFPSQEFNAIDVVVRYAISELGFAFEDVTLFAWSIGGYTATCAAMSYPDIGAVILDATFDDLYPLIQPRIHPILGAFCHGMVKEFFDLNISEQICRYQGPVLLVRRSYDEMMSPSDASSNRCNFLLIKLLQNRYPNLVNEQTLPSLWRWLQMETDEERSRVLSTFSVNTGHCLMKLQSYKSAYGPSYPWTIGDEMSPAEKTELLLFLAGQYMLNYESTHCVALPLEYFRIPSAGNL